MGFSPPNDGGRIDGQVRRRLASFPRDLPIRIDDEMALHAWQATTQLAE